MASSPARFADAKFAARLTEIGGVPFASTPDEFRSFIAELSRSGQRSSEQRGSKLGRIRTARTCASPNTDQTC
jgi:hypothetical protein